MAAFGQGKAIPAPIGGWNAKDDWDGMKETEAIELINWFPSTDSVDSRLGYRVHSTGLTGKVESLMEYEAQDTNQLLSAASGVVYNSTTGTSLALKGGFINSRWQHVNFDAKLGMVNGDDLPQEWDGLALTDMTISGAGLDVRNLIDCEVYNNRVYYVEKNRQDVWYTPIDSLGGVLTKFPLSRVGQFGGNLIAIGTWTRDSGDGADDWIAFIMSSGEIIDRDWETL